MHDHPHNPQAHLARAAEQAHTPAQGQTPAASTPLGPSTAFAPPPAGASGQDVVTDGRGRKLTLRKLSVVDQTRLLRAIGAQQSSNQPYVNLVMQAAMVADIDGRPLPWPINEAMIDHIMGEVGDDGMAVLTARMINEFREIEKRANAALLEGVSDPGPLHLSG